MRAVSLGADWVTRAAWGLSAAVHAGAVAAALGWGEPATTPVPQVIAVSVVALSPAAGPGGEVLAEDTAAGAPPGERSSAEAPDLPSTPETLARPEAAAPPPFVAEARRDPPAPPPAMATAQPEDAAPAGPDPTAAAPAREDAAPPTAVLLPVPLQKPSPPVDMSAAPPSAPAPASAAARPADVAPAAGSPPQTALPARPAAPESARSGSGAGSSGAVERAGPSIAGISNPAPSYPMTSRMRGEEGTVVLEIAVSATGTVTSVRVVESSGHPRLDRAAAEAVRHWRFAPARIGDRPIDAVIRHPVIFRLDR